MQIEKQTDPAKTGLVRCLVSKSHGSEVCNCCVQRAFFLSRQDHEVAACRSFAYHLFIYYNSQKFPITVNVHVKD